MSARTDRIAKLDSLIAGAIAKNQPNNAQKLADKRDDFARLSDEKYDEVMAVNQIQLDTGLGYFEAYEQWLTAKA